MFDDERVFLVTLYLNDENGDGEKPHEEQEDRRKDATTLYVGNLSVSTLQRTSNQIFTSA